MFRWDVNSDSNGKFHCGCNGDVDCGGQAGTCVGGFCYNSSGNDYQRAAVRAKNHFGSSNHDAIYYVALKPELPGWGCGLFHGTTRDVSKTSFVPVPYLPSYCTPATDLDGYVTHEMLEQITDPQTNGSMVVAWTSSAQGGETCDVCCQVQPCGRKVFLEASSNVYNIPKQISNKGKNGAGDCVFSRSTRVEKFHQSGGTLRYYSETNTDSPGTASFSNLGAPSGVTLRGSPSAASWGNGRIDVFMRDTTLNTIRHAYSFNSGTTFSWDNWGTLPAGCTNATDPDVLALRPQRVDVFVACPSRVASTLYKRRYDNGVTDASWTTIPLTPGPGNTLGSKVTSSSWGVDTTSLNARMDLFVLAGTSPLHLWHAYSSNNGSTYTWEDLGNGGNVPQGDPDAATTGPGTYDVVMYDGTGNILHYAFASSVGTFTTIAPPTGITFHGKMSIVALGDNRMHIAVKDQNGNLQVYRYEEGAFIGWQNDGGGFATGTDGPDMAAW